MKDKRLDALLETLPVLNDPHLKCHYYSTKKKDQTLCDLAECDWDCHTDCQGDIRKCEREE